MDMHRALGFHHLKNIDAIKNERQRIRTHIHLQLRAMDLPVSTNDLNEDALKIADTLLSSYRQKSRLLINERVPVDARIEAFLNAYFAGLQLPVPLRLPNQSLTLDRHGMARELSLPSDGSFYQNSILSSFRVKNGVLHNPLHDRRTTSGTFHVTDGGLPIPDDKKIVPQITFVKLFQAALNPPEEFLKLPFTINQELKASSFVSLYLRPLVCPEVQGVTAAKKMEVRFFAPGGFVSNLDFVESIFGNAGDPLLPINDAGLDVEHWTGHTGCVILAPHLITLTKKDVGLPHIDQATPRQLRDKMCWKDEHEKYNDGQAFKLTCRNHDGVIVTLIADNYYGYCKKEVKTQISYAANLFGHVEEEHSGGAVAYARYNLGERFQVNSQKYNGRTFNDVARDYADFIHVMPEGYGVDKHYSQLKYIPADAVASLREQHISWVRNGEKYEIPLLPGHIYMAPSGYKLSMEKHPAAPSWRLVGEIAEGVFCHKPCTVSGGGKSEIGKSLLDYMHYGPIFVNDIKTDFEFIQKILDYDYATRWKPNAESKPDYSKRKSRPILSEERSLGSVIKLLTPSTDYTDEFNKFLESIPQHIYAQLYIIKRFSEAGWDKSWQDHFNVDLINGQSGHELKFRNRHLVASYLRVGFDKTAKWRTFKLRQDFIAATKVQREDDISASMVVPSRLIKNLKDEAKYDSQKFVENCEYRFFQRPDEAIHRGFDKQAEADLAGPDNFVSNFEPLTKDDVARMAEYVADFDAFSQPMQKLLNSMLEEDDYDYVACSANPRKVDGKPSKNPRYLQVRPDITDSFKPYMAERGLRLHRVIPIEQVVPVPVHAVLMGRRNNPPEPEKGIPSLAVYSPIHYQEYPELFMDLICSLTGKSPSTTGFGSEGALTKGPFNAVRTSADLNTALVSYILTGQGVFSTSAGHVGPNIQVDHDISLLIPEIWCRLTPEDRDPEYMIKEGCLEKLKDFTHKGEVCELSRLGYRITQEFMRRYCGRVFDNPDRVFDEDILKPELQDMDVFVQGVKYICEDHKKNALKYFDDGTYEELVPPLQAILNIMAYGHFEGKKIHDPAIRSMFTKEAMLASSWYHKRLETKVKRDAKHYQKRIAYLEEYLSKEYHKKDAQELNIPARLSMAQKALKHLENSSVQIELQGFLGADPMGEKY